MDTATEKEILEAVLAGQKERFEAIVIQYQGRAVTVAMGLVRNHNDAMDLCQDAFLRAYRALHSFDTSLPFFPWFYRILRNLCLSHLKRRRRTLSLTVRNRDDEENDIDIPSGAPDPADLLEKNEDIERCYASFGYLSFRDREILTLRHFQDLSYAEIAHSLDIPIGTVMSRLFYARKKLRERMESFDDR